MFVRHRTQNVPSFHSKVSSRLDYDVDDCLEGTIGICFDDVPRDLCTRTLVATWVQDFHIKVMLSLCLITGIRQRTS